jgi:peptidoglycan/LPS O-acetylase OafA/YrhL
VLNNLLSGPTLPQIILGIGMLCGPPFALAGALQLVWFRRRNPEASWPRLTTTAVVSAAVGFTVALVIVFASGGWNTTLFGVVFLPGVIAAIIAFPLVAWIATPRESRAA